MSACDQCIYVLSYVYLRSNYVGTDKELCRLVKNSTSLGNVKLTKKSHRLSQFLELLLSAKWTMAKLVPGAHWCYSFMSRSKPPGATQCWVAPKGVARLLFHKWTTTKLVFGAHWRDCFTSRATSLGATLFLVVPRDVVRLVKQSHQWAPKTSFAVVHFADKSSSRNWLSFLQIQ
jgi:hypothetical protein